MCPELGPLKKYTSVVMKPNPAVWKHLSLKGLPGNWPAVWFFSAYTSTPHEGRQCVVGMWIVSPGSGCVCVCVLECVRVCVCVCRSVGIRIKRALSHVCVIHPWKKKRERKKEGSVFLNSPITLMSCMSCRHGDRPPLWFSSSSSSTSLTEEEEEEEARLMLHRM